MRIKEKLLIFTNDTDKITDLMQSDEERGGYILYSKVNNVIIFNELIELKNTAEDKKTKYLPERNETIEDYAKTKICMESLMFGEYHTHPSGSAKMSKIDREVFTKKKKVYKDFILMIISKENIMIYD